MSIPLSSLKPTHLDLTMDPVEPSCVRCLGPNSLMDSTLCARCIAEDKPGAALSGARLNQLFAADRPPCECEALCTCPGM